MASARLSEKGLIDFISGLQARSKPSMLCGIGDDAAVLSFHGKLIATCDALQEGIHFDWKWASPFLLGRKSLAVNLSDMAAMGGKPLWALLCFAVPRNEKPARIREFLKGLQSIADEFGVAIVGGDTDHSKQGWRISLTLLGEARHPVYRSAARAGDDVWVTGSLGASALGLAALKCGSKALAAREFTELHLNPTPRVREGQALAQEKLASALMDISDGLCLDLERLCRASKVGARVEWPCIPFAAGFESLCAKLGQDPKSLALSGGEDYELLFTASPRKRRRIEALSKKRGFSFCRIGKIVSGKGVKVLDAGGKALAIAREGYEHF